MHRLPLASILERAEATVAGRRAELDALDAALGDGDHGSNLAALCDALAREHPRIAGMPLPDALRRIASLFESVMGGSGGAMYGALLRGMAEAADAGELDWPGALAMFDAGLAALERASGLGAGAKTMLDVLLPVRDALHRAPPQADAAGLGALAVAAAAHAMHHTRDVEARWQPAARLGRASVEHIDPGACSAALLIGAIVGALTDEPAVS